MSLLIPPENSSRKGSRLSKTTSSEVLKRAKTFVRHWDIAFPILIRQILFGLYKLHSLHNGEVRSLPKEIVVLVTRKCFLNCAICGTKHLYDNDERFADFFPTGDLKKLADEVSAWPHKPYIKMTGGEASLHPDFFEILDYFSSKKLSVRLSSNGVNFAKPDKALALVKSGVDVITISLDGTQESHNTLRRGVGLYDKVLLAVSNIQEAKKHLQRNKPMIQIATIVSADNYLSLPMLAEELEKMKIDWWHIGFIQHIRQEWGEKSQEVCRSFGGVGDDKWKFWMANPLSKITMDMEELASSLRETLSCRPSFPISMLNLGGISKKNLQDFHYTDSPIHNSLCANPYVSMVVLAPGLATFCIDFPQFFYGDIRKKSLKEIWFSRKANEFRKNFLTYFKSNQKNMPHCTRCLWRFW